LAAAVGMDEFLGGEFLVVHVFDDGADPVELEVGLAREEMDRRAPELLVFKEAAQALVRSNSAIWYS